NRWGDFTTTQVDPCDDQSLWTLQEYAKTRTSTDDGTTGSNGSKWGTWWAEVAGPMFSLGFPCPTDTIATPGSAFSRHLRITNTGTAAGTVSYSVTDGAGWAAPQSGTTPLLAPSSFFDIFVQISVPGDCNPPS